MFVGWASQAVLDGLGSPSYEYLDFAPVSSFFHIVRRFAAGDGEGGPDVVFGSLLRDAAVHVGGLALLSQVLPHRSVELAGPLGEHEDQGESDARFAGGDRDDEDDQHLPAPVLVVAAKADQAQ